MAAEYALCAERYDRRWRAYVRRSVALTAGAFTPGPTDRVLDAGCGTGLLLHRLRARHPSLGLHGVDLTRSTLQVARRRLPGGTPLVQAPAEALPYRDGVFDAWVSSSVLHFVPSPGAGFHEARRVLRPGGTLVLTDWCRDYTTIRLLDAYLRWRDPAHVRAYTAKELRRMLEGAGFRVGRVERRRIGLFWGVMTVVAERVPGSG